MINLFKALIYAALFSATAHAKEPQDVLSNTGKYVSINVEIKELKESGIILRDATTKLADTLDDVSKNIDNLSPEQLILINSLADKVDGITVKLNQAVNDLPNAIKRAQAPSSELLHQSLQQVKDEAINPVTDKLEMWLIVTIVGLCILGISLALGLAYCAKRIGHLGITIKQIADGYRIIPVEQYKDELKQQD